jgi:hypothetical protein
MAGLPRTLPECDATLGSQSGAAGSGSPKKQRSSLQLSRTAAAEAAGDSSGAPGSPRVQQLLQQQQVEGASKGAALDRSDSSLSNRSDGARSAAGNAAAGSACSSSSGSGGTGKATLGGDASAAVCGSSAAAQQRQPAGVLDLAVKAFDTRK